jgi:Na+-translocating ferredoxin:NAD+ oxidoreductase subunit D
VKTFATATPPHWPAARSVRQVMTEVLIALLPGIAVHVWLFDAGLLLQLALACTFALLLEALLLRLRGRPPQPFPGDGAALVTAVLFCLCIPPLCPWWISALGLLAALGLAKHAYGGLGYNLFNPAMAGYALLLLAFPRELAQWPAAAVGFSESLRAIFSNGLATQWDSIASATPLDALRQAAAAQRLRGELAGQPVFGHFGAARWEWLALAYAAGGLWLVWRRVVAWQVPAGVIGMTLLLGGLAWLADAERNPPPLQHLAGGGLMLAAWFIAADPVTGCSSPRGRLLFGAGVAALTLALRRWGAQPDGVAFAVLCMNACAPLIDRATRPRIYGHAHD